MARQNVRVKKTGVVSVSRTPTGVSATASAGTAVGSSSSSGYDLTAALADLPFTVNLPTAPTTTTTATCTTAAEITASLAVNGRRTNIAAGTYSLASIWAPNRTDAHIVCAEGVTINITGDWVNFASSQRVRWEGGTINTSASNTLVQASSASDFAMVGVTLRSTASGGFSTGNISAGAANRILLQSCDIESNTSTAFVHGTGASVNDFVIANCRIYNTRAAGAGNGWALRMGGQPNRVVFVDSFWRAIENTVIRIEPYAGVDYYIADNLVFAGGFAGMRITPEASSTATNVYCYDNTFYHVDNGTGTLATALVAIDAHPDVANLYADGNTGYSADSGPSPDGWEWTKSSANWTIGTNPITYTPGVLPGSLPTWTMQ